MVRTKWFTDKMVYGQNVIGQNSIDKTVRIASIDFISI